MGDPWPVSLSRRSDWRLRIISSFLFLAMSDAKASEGFQSRTTTVEKWQARWVLPIKTASQLPDWQVLDEEPMSQMPDDSQVSRTPLDSENESDDNNQQLAAVVAPVVWVPEVVAPVLLPPHTLLHWSVNEDFAIGKRPDQMARDPVFPPDMPPVTAWAFNHVLWFLSGGYHRQCEVPPVEEFDAAMWIPAPAQHRRTEFAPY